MTTLIKIGNSQGIRVPKAIIKQAHLENAQLEFKIVQGGLLVKPIHNTPRAQWDENIQTVLASHKGKKDAALMEELLDDSDLDDYEW